MRNSKRAFIAGVCTAAALASASISGAGVAATGSAAGRDGGPGDEALRSELQAASGGSARFASSDSGDVTFVGATADHPLQASSDAGLSAIGRRFVDQYGPLFGVGRDSELVELRAVADDSAASSGVRYQQTYRGVPVLAGVVAVQVDGQGAVVSANGEASSRLDIDTSNTVAADEAAASGVALVARVEEVDPATLAAGSPELWIYDPALIGNTDDTRVPRLVWKMDVRTPIGDIDRMVLIDAHTGAVALQFNQREDAENRSVCDNVNNRFKPENCAVPGNVPLRTEGGPAVVGNPEVNAAYDYSGETYNFFAQFGRDSLDGMGLPLKSTVRYCPDVSCPGVTYDNAFWNGTQMVYGQGYPLADDIVGHELTHGLTQFTSGLLYYADAGAINESMSDVMGEFIDQSNDVDPADDWKLAEDLPGEPNGLRNMKNPAQAPFFDPDRIQSPLFHKGLSDTRGVHSNSGINNKAAYLITAGASFNGQTVTGIGLPKAAAIYYFAETTMLTPGSDYIDLAHILPQACMNLIGAAPWMITADNCTQVSNAVIATEMDQHPTATGTYLTAPVCDSGAQGTVQFSDNMEAANGNWVSSNVEGGAPWLYAAGAGTTGSQAFTVEDVGAPRGISIATAQTGTAVGFGTTFMRFDHSFNTDSFVNDTTPALNKIYDGGVVEYSTDGGANWTDISVLPVINGYNGPINGAVFGGKTNLLAGRQAFGTTSPNFETTRVDLSPLAGQNVRFRFSFSIDNYPDLSYEGWFIDNVSIYTCTSTPTAPVNVTARSSDGAAIVSWSPPLSDGSLPNLGYDITPYVGGVAQPVVTTPAGATSFSVPGLSNGTTYTFTVVARNSMGTGPQSAASNPATAFAAFAPLVPRRLLDTRPGGVTVDTLFAGIGLLHAPGSVTQLDVAGRGGIAADAAAVVLNVTVTEAQAPGYVTLYPCGGAPPTASNLNYVAGSTIPNLVVVKVGTNGQVCLFTQSAVHLIADVSGFFPANSSLVSLVPARLLDSRGDGITVDGVSQATGQPAGGSVTEVQVAGRAGIPADASAAVLNVTVTEAGGPGYVTVYPCGSAPPTASNLNYVAGQTIPNAVITKIGAGGKVCIFTQQPAHLLADVNGYFPAGATLLPLVPARLLDSRVDGKTIDGQSQGIGQPAAGSVTEVVVAGRGGVPADATAVALNVTVTESSAPGYATVYPCGSAPPTASNLNYGTGTTIANAVITQIGAGGKVCIFTQQATHLLADVNAYFAG